MGDLRDQLLRDYADAWRPEAGDVLIGTVVSVDEGRGFAGDPYPIVTVRGADGSELAFHAFHEVAKDELARLKPKIGEELGIAYLGKHPEKSYVRYRIKVVREEGGVDWSAMTAVEPEVTPASPPPSPERDEIPF